MTKGEYLNIRRELTAHGFKVRKESDMIVILIGLNPDKARSMEASEILHAHNINNFDIALYNNGLMAFHFFINDFYAPRLLWIWDDETRTATTRDYFIINGEFEDGTKVWTRCDKNGNYQDNCGYTVGKRDGKMIAFLEFVD